MNETNLIIDALAVLTPLGFKATLQKGNLRANAREVNAFARTVTPATLGAILAQTKAQALEHGKPVVLVTDYVTPPVADRLREAGQQFLDIAGNAYLEAPGWLIYVVGRKAVQTGAPAHAARGGTPAGLKVLFALLCEPALIDLPQREIAKQANVALGAIPGILNDLRDQGHVLVMPGIRRLNANKRLLDEWAMAYARTMRPKTLVAAYNAPTVADWKTWVMEQEGTWWGGEPAAAIITDYLRPGVLTIYTEKLPAKFIHEHRLTKVPNDNRGRLEAMVEVRKPFWGTALQQHYEIMTGPAVTVPPVLVYADLLATGDARCIETAEVLYDKHIAPILTPR
jgi:hypothetical protein